MDDFKNVESSGDIVIEITSVNNAMVKQAAKFQQKKYRDEEKKFFKDQMVDLLKGVGIVLPLQLIPLPFVSTILLIIVEKTMLSMGIKVLPSSFYNES